MRVAFAPIGDFSGYNTVIVYGFHLPASRACLFSNKELPCSNTYVGLSNAGCFISLIFHHRPTSTKCHCLLGLTSLYACFCGFQKPALRDPAAKLSCGRLTQRWTSRRAQRSGTVRSRRHALCSVTVLSCRALFWRWLLKKWAHFFTSDRRCGVWGCKNGAKLVVGFFSDGCKWPLFVFSRHR